MDFPSSVRTNMRKCGPVESTKLNSDRNYLFDLNQLYQKLKGIEAKIRELKLSEQQIMVQIDEDQKRCQALR